MARRVCEAFDQGLVGRRFDGNGLLQKPEEQFAAAARLAAVEAKSELVEVRVAGAAKLG